MTLMVGTQATLMVPYMFEPDPQPDYYDTILPYVFSCDMWEYPERDGTPTRNPVKWWMNCTSFTLFENPKILPMIFNIGVMPLVYFLGYYITNDRLIGLIAISAFVWNPLYTDWQTNATYDQTWAFFLLLSLVVMFRFNSGVRSYLSYAVSIAAKSMAIMYLPLFVVSSWISSKSKRNVLFYLFCTGVIVFVATSRIDIIGNSIGFYPENIEQALFRNISLFWQVIPALIGLAGINSVFHAKEKPKNKRLVIVWMIGILLMTPIIHLFTQQLTFSYRYVPFAAFMSIFAGITLVELGNFIVESRQKILAK